MNQIKIKFMGNVLIIITLIFAITLNFFLAFFVKYHLTEIKSNLVFYTMLTMTILYIPAFIYLTKSTSKAKDLFLIDNNFMQNGTILFTRHDLISIKKINVIKTEIKYLKDSKENIIFVTISNKKLNQIKTLLSIDE